MDSSFITRILSSIKEYGDKTAVVDCNAGRRTSYNQIHSMALKVVSLIRSEGVRKGSYVAVLLPGKVEFVAAELGIWLAGCVCVPIGFSTPADRRDYILNHCGCTFRIDGETFAEAMKRSPAKDVPVPDEDDEALLSYTSGSTGRPKGIVLTFKSFVNPLGVMDEVIKAGPQDRYLSGSRTYFILHLMFYVFLKGTEVHILRPQEISDLTSLQRYAREQRITVMFLSPALLASYRNEDSDLRMIMTGSDKVTSVNPDGYTVSVFYGMSEVGGAMLYGCFDKPTSNVTYNGVINDFKVKVDEPDENGEGELCLKGPCCKGYFKDEEATSALFRDGWLHTGDVVRRLEDGSLLYVNRKDWMVKINGQRVEPGEVEAAMMAVDGVEDALVKGFVTSGGSARLVGYYISSTATEDDVREGLEKSVPSYMIPSAFVRMDSFPLNANGKKDRKALEEPAAVSADYVAPSTPVEKELCEAFAKVLSLPSGGRVGVNDDFYALGGDSISVMSLLKMCPELDLSSRIIYLKRTPAAIAAGLEGGKAGMAAAEAVEAPLTRTQLGIYAECDRRAGEAVYNNPFLFRIDGELDLERLADAFRTAFAAHPVLGARIAIGRDGSPVMRLEPGSAPQVKSRRMTESGLESLKQELVRPFDLRKDCLCRLTLIKTEKSGYIFIDVHHIIFDGSSMGILLKDVDTAYNGGKVETEAFSAFDVANRERRERLTDAYSEARKWYIDNFGDYDAVSLPSPDLVSSSRESFDRFRAVLPVGEEGVRGFCAANGVTPAVLASAVFGYVMSRYTFSHKFAFATIYNGRQDLRTERTVSMLVKTLPVCGEIAPGQRVKDFLSSVKERLVGAMANDIYSFSELSEATGLGSDVLFAYQGGIRDIPAVGGASLEDLHLEFNATGESLSTQLFSSPEGLVLDVQYRSDMYSRPFIEGLASSYGTALGSMMKAATLSEVSILDAGEAARLTELSYGSKLEYDAERTIPGRFREAAASNPSSMAVVCGAGSYTYGELDSVSDAVAAKLVAAGVGAGEFVCIMLPRCREFAAAVLGIQKAGAAYVPVDIEYPEDRKNYMVTDSGAKVVIKPEFFNDLPAGGPVDLSQPGNPAYMIYTSGSTGKPKGVVITHASVMACAAWNIPLCGMEPGRRYLHHPSFSFDASTMDLLYPLMAGAEVHILQEELRKDLGAVHRYCIDNGIYGMTTSTAMGMALLNQYELPVNYVIMGGEKMLSARHTDARIINGYGPTEFTVCSSYHVVDQDRDSDIPIGRPVPNSWSVVCDADGRLLPQGVSGELCLIGPQIAQGYWHRPEVTEEKFCRIGFEGDFGTDRMYRTGDLARYNARGELEFCGRIDFQVKLRGFRIELGEIEACASSLEGVTAAAAEVRKAGGQDMLCLYYTADSDIDDAQLRGHLSKSLTSYMVPDCCIKLDAMPLTPNGKVNRRALPEPNAVASDRVAPETEAEKKIFALAAEVLGYDGFGVEDNLLSMGLTSLSAMKLSALLEQREGMEVPTRTILEYGTVRSIASRADSDASKGTIQEAEVHPVREFYPLSESQKGVYMDWEMNRSALQYNTPFARKFSGCDAERLKSAVEAVVNAHPALKSQLATEDSEVVVRRRDGALPTVSVSSLDFEPDAGFFHTRVKPFDLFGDELYRFEIYVSPSSLYLFADIHHIIYDGGSTMVFFRDLELALSGEQVRKETYTAFDRTLDEKALMASDEYSKSERYFEELLSDFEVASWPHSAVPDSKTPGASRCRAVLKAAAVESFCRDNALTANSFFMASFSELLRRVLRSGSLLYTSVSGGRTNAAMQDIVGMFVKTFPVVSPDPSDGPASEYVKAVQQQYVATMSNGLYPYAEMVARFGCRSEIMFNFEGGASFEASDTMEMGLDTVKMPLTLSIRPEGDEFAVIAEYDTSLYSAADMTLLVESMASLSAGIAAAGTALPIRRVPMLGDAESKRVIELSYGSKLEYDAERTIPGRFREAAAYNPSSMAVVCGAGSYTYGELDGVSDAVAAKLVAAGVGAGEFVCIMLPRCREFAAAVLGIQKAGAAYVPVDIEYPEDRKNYMVTDSGAKVVIKPEFFNDLPAGGPVDLSQPGNPAYMIYTSGSTGKPKGVVITHASVMACAAWVESGYGVARGRKFLNHPSFSFDASTLDLLYPLMVGAEVHILQEEVRRDLGAVYRYCLDNGIYGMAISTAMGMALLNQYDMPVHYMMLGGEKLLQVKRTKVRLINGYGPTEFTVCSSYHVVDQDRDTADIPIGRPVPNSWSVVCDADGQLLPQGMVGELCLIGPQIAQGYWHRPEVTEEKFCRIRFEGDFGTDRMYRTGDLARYNADGELEFCGRIDFQVKLRGFRIEMGEIEACASSLEGITSAVAEVRKAGGQDTLCLYYTADREIDDAQMRGYLSKSLTSYMVPDCYVRLDAMPLTPNGKVNRKALPEPAGGPTHEYEAPQGKEEEFFCETFSKVLGVGKVGATDNFFDIGGTSIVAMRIVAAADEAGRRIAYKDVFDNPTPRALAALVSGSAAGTGAGDKPADEVADYDYSAIDKVLSANTMENFKTGASLVVGNALVTGATGYLGIHVLHELVRSGDVDHIYCLVRAGHGGQTPERRLRSMLFYYFNDDFDSLFRSGRLAVVDGDVTRPESLEVLYDKDINTVFNCAAVVKHFSAGTDIEDVNVGGTRCCIDFCLKTGAKLIHTSTLNVAGTTVCDSRTEGHTLTERELYWGQTLENRYCRSKFIAERSVLEAVASKGLTAKIMRLGNLASRSSDGEFQINFRSNSSMGQLKAFQTLGCIPYEMITGDIEFSPIDEVSKAVVLLSRTPAGCCVFHASTVQHQVFGNVIKCMNDVGIPIAMVENDLFNARLTEALKNPRKADILQSMLAYSSGGDRFEVLNGSECTYSAQVLLRLGFFWKFTTWDYIEQFLRAINGLGFFDEDYSR